MNEKIANYDRISTICGIVTLNIESIDDLTTEILSRPNIPQPLSVEHLDDLSEIENSYIEHRYDAAEAESRIYAQIPVDLIDRDSTSDDRVIRLLYDYFVDEAGFDKDDVEVTYEDDIAYLYIHMPSGATISVEYSKAEPMLAMLSQFGNDGIDEDTIKELAVDTLQVWAYLHDIALYMCDAPYDASIDYRLTVSAASQPLASLVLLRSLAEYDLWAEQIGTNNLPTIDYTAIDFNAIGKELAKAGDYSQADMLAAVRSLAVSLRGFGGNQTLTAADIKFAVLD